MGISDILSNLGYPLSFETFMKKKATDDGWYFFEDDLSISADGKFYVLGREVRPKVWARIAALYEKHDRRMVRIMLRMFDWKKIAPTWYDFVKIDGIFFDVDMPFDYYGAWVQYDPMRGGFFKIDGRTYFVNSSQIGIDELGVATTPCGMVSYDLRNKTVEEVFGPLGYGEYVKTDKTFADLRPRKSGNYHWCTIDETEVIRGPWVHIVDWETWTFDTIDKMVRPGWTLIRTGYLKKTNNLYYFENTAEDEYCAINRWGVEVYCSSEDFGVLVDGGNVYRRLLLL